MDSAHAPRDPERPWYHQSAPRCPRPRAVYRLAQCHPWPVHWAFYRRTSRRRVFSYRCAYVNGARLFGAAGHRQLQRRRSGAARFYWWLCCAHGKIRRRCCVCGARDAFHYNPRAAAGSGLAWRHSYFLLRPRHASHHWADFPAARRQPVCLARKARLHHRLDRLAGRDSSAFHRGGRLHHGAAESADRVAWCRCERLRPASLGAAVSALRVARLSCRAAVGNSWHRIWPNAARRRRSARRQPSATTERLCARTSNTRQCSAFVCLAAVGGVRRHAFLGAGAARLSVWASERVGFSGRASNRLSSRCTHACRTDGVESRPIAAA